MATTLTFQPGRVPGIWSATPARPAPIGGMSKAQRDALAALIHEPIGASGTGAERRDLGAALVWLIATATTLLWSVAIAFALVQEMGWLPRIDTLMAAGSPASHAVAAPAAAHTVAHQSSATVNRTM
jgi:hypothetical protein